MNKVNDISISDNSFISLHVQLHNQLRHLILSGRWVSGSRIPSENELTSHLNISRSTVRLALQQAEIEGLIERAAGRGTFVAPIISKDIRRRLIAFLTCSFDAENHLLMLNGAEQEGRARGYQIVFSNAQNQEEEFEILQRLKEEGIAGVLLWANARASKALEPNVIRYQQVKVPIVLMDRTIYGLDCDCVTSDNYGGTRALMRHLVDLGHQHIVFLSHYEMEILPVAERYRAYCDVLAETGLSAAEPWIIGEPGIEVSASYALQSSLNYKNPVLQQIRNTMLNAQPRPTAIFAVNDYLAVLASRAMKQLELQVPDMVSIAGFDDTDLAAHLEVPLTTVAQDAFTIGKRAAHRLIDRIEGDAGDTLIELIPTELRIRSSTSVPVQV